MSFSSSAANYEDEEEVCHNIILKQNLKKKIFGFRRRIFRFKKIIENVVRRMTLKEKISSRKCLKIYEKTWLSSKKLQRKCWLTQYIDTSNNLPFCSVYCSGIESKEERISWGKKWKCWKNIWFFQILEQNVENLKEYLKIWYYNNRRFFLLKQK